MPFRRLGLCPETCSGIRKAGYQKPSKIQARAIPLALQGRDLIAQSRTGTGKTLAFAAPVLDRLLAKGPREGLGPRALCLVPTRELAVQIEAAFARYGVDTGLSVLALFGGLKDKSNEAALVKGVDILIATPGRLMDLMGQGRVSLADLLILVLDEADRMLDMGFLPDLKRIEKTMPAERQTLLFGATMARGILGFAEAMTKHAIEVNVDVELTLSPELDQKVYFVPMREKAALLHWLLTEKAPARCLVFTRTRRTADRLAERLAKEGHPVEAFHAERSQKQRLDVLAAFADGGLQVLVASDVASRGLDVERVDLVINYDVPGDADTYVHRIGRTGRAGRAGVACTFCDSRDFDALRRIEAAIRTKIPVILEHPFRSGAMLPPPPAPRGRKGRVRPGKARMPHPAREARRRRNESEASRPAKGAKKKRSRQQKKKGKKKRGR